MADRPFDGRHLVALLERHDASAASLAASASRQAGSEAKPSYQRQISGKRPIGSAMA